MHKISLGDRVEAGEFPEEYDTGQVILIERNEITVAWDGGSRTTQPAALLRPEGQRPLRRSADV